MNYMKLLIRSDDLGYSEAVNYGIEKAMRFGLSRSIGLMTNMPAAAHGVSLIKDLDVCIGQHTNICVGRPLMDPALIPSIVGEDGCFKRSQSYRMSAEDFVIVDEAILEIEAQYNRFCELTGHEPEYFEAHAVRSENFNQAMKIVAERHGLKYSTPYNPHALARIGGTDVNSCLLESMSPDYDPVQSLKKEVKNGRRDIPNLYVCHPGYLDAYLLRTSSLTINRTREVEMLTSTEVRDWLESQDVVLISHRDLV
ncbi:MAG: ChbG/HpnK family deacetylase [Lachnospiraceae bacterium]|nr:ChbG/HpnK family deacetylase [Lachnospiraceae bacterium]